MVNKFGKAKKTRGKSPNTHRHKNYVPSIINRVIEEADIILEILDSRFIEKTRNFEIEKKVKKLGKFIIHFNNDYPTKDFSILKWFAKKLKITTISIESLDRIL